MLSLKTYQCSGNHPCLLAHANYFLFEGAPFKNKENGATIQYENGFCVWFYAVFLVFVELSSNWCVRCSPKCLSTPARRYQSAKVSRTVIQTIVVLTFMKTRDGTFLFVFLWSFDNKGFQPTLQLSFVNVAYSLQLVALWIGMAISIRPYENDFHQC